MPTLKQITCSIELGPSNVKLKEYGHRYTDGSVQTFVAVPDTNVPFSIHLKSDGYIAPGLAAYVFIDGVYHTNRNKTGLKMPGDGVRPEDYEVEFRFRQKEEKTQARNFVATEWTFAALDITNADDCPSLNPNFLKNVGTIEVVVLRAKSEAVSVPRPDVPATQPIKSKSKRPVAPSVAASQAKSERPNSELGGMFGLFDGAGDDPFVDQPQPRGQIVTGKDGVVQAIAAPGFMWDPVQAAFVPINEMPQHEGPPSSVVRRYENREVPSYGLHQDQIGKDKHVVIHDKDKRIRMAKYGPLPDLDEFYAAEDQVPVYLRRWPKELAQCKNEMQQMKSQYARLAQDHPNGRTPEMNALSQRYDEARDRLDTLEGMYEFIKQTAGPEEVQKALREAEEEKIVKDRTAQAMAALDQQLAKLRAQQQVDGGYHAPPPYGMQAAGEGVIRQGTALNKDWKVPHAQKPSSRAPTTTGSPKQKHRNQDGAPGWAGDGWNEQPMGGGSGGNNGWDSTSAKNGAQDPQSKWDNPNQNDNANKPDDYWANPPSQGQKAPSNFGGADNKSHSSAAQQSGHWTINTPVPDAHVKKYFAEWQKASTPLNPADMNIRKKRDIARPIYIYPSDPLPKVPADKVGDATHGVQTGKGADYSHRRFRPVYLDTMEKPYAVFSFKYRSKEALETILRKSIDSDVAKLKEKTEMDMLQSMPKRKLIERLLKFKSSKESKQNTPAASVAGWAAPPASVKQSWGNDNQAGNAGGWDVANSKAHSSHAGHSNRNNAGGDNNDQDGNAGGWGNTGSKSRAPSSRHSDRNKVADNGGEQWPAPEAKADTPKTPEHNLDNLSQRDFSARGEVDSQFDKGSDRTPSWAKASVKEDASTVKAGGAAAEGANKGGQGFNKELSVEEPAGGW